jgi:NADH-quinone oxidoreductase subunit G
MAAGYDSPMGAGTGAAVLFGNSGGVTEAAVRTVYELATGKPLPKLDFEAVRGLAGVKRATVQLPLGGSGGGGGGEGGSENSSSSCISSSESSSSAPAAAKLTDLRIAVVSGIANARRLLSAMRAGTAPPLEFVEVMTCAGGCVGGGGQPKSRDPDAVRKRMQSVYSLDASAPLRKSHDNPEVGALYREALGGAPGSHAAHALLHTTYQRRPKLV